MPRYTLCKTLEDVITFIDQTERDRDILSLETDGVVIKVNDYALYESVGKTAKAPRGAVAYKFAASHGITKVVDLLLQVSRFGTVNPVARVDPVRIGGTKITHATLHNFDEIDRLGVAVGDMVAIKRAGDVIPKIIRVQEESSASARCPIKIPMSCPSCGASLTVEKCDSTTVVTCPRKLTCKAQMAGRILHFASRKSMDINGLGAKTVEKLIAAGLLRTPSDLFQLQKTDIIENIAGFKERSASNLISAITKAASGRSLARLIVGLGVPGVGETSSVTLASHVGTIEGLLAIAENAKDSLLTIPNIAEKSAEAIIAFFGQREVQSELRVLKEVITLQKSQSDERVPPSKNASPIVGKTFVFTGPIGTMSRAEAAAAVTIAGGRVRQTVSKLVDYVVLGKNNSVSAKVGSSGITSKLRKSRALGIVELDEEQFSALLDDKSRSSANENGD